MIAFYRSIGLQCCLADLGLKEVSKQHLIKMAHVSCYEGSHIYKMSVPEDEESLVDAIQLIDSLGRSVSSDFKRI
jgi:glycerol dehydrogenase